MYIETFWLLVGLLIIIIIAYRIGNWIGRIEGYYKYDKELEAMQRKGEVVFPGIDIEDDL